MSFTPIQIKFYGNGCKVGNYTNLKSSPVYTFPKDSRSGWLSNQAYPPAKPSTAIIKSGCKYTELYNTREQYVNESQKQKAPCYSFGKAGMKEDEFYIKTKRKKRAKSAKNKNITFNEENLAGDNCENNPNKANKSEGEESYHQYYEIGQQFVNESRKPKAPLYSFCRKPYGEDYITKSKIDKKFLSPNDFYETTKYYIKESKKPRVVGYSFGNEKRIDPNIKKKWKYKIYGGNKENNKNNTFKEENNFKQADNNPNINNNEENKEKQENDDKDNKDENSNKNNKNNKKNKKAPIATYNNSKDYPHDFYNVREHYIYESKKPRVVGYSFGVKSGVKPKIIEGKKGEEPLFYNLREHYIYESQKPKAPNYSFGRPGIFFSFTKNKKKNKNYKLRPQSAEIHRNIIVHYVENENGKKIKKISKIDGPGPGSYDTAGIIGEDALKISISPCGRKGPVDNRFPGPGSYHPRYYVVKKQYPIYSIGNAERDCYEGYYPINNSMKLPYGAQYFRRNPSWAISKRNLIDNIKNENYRYSNSIKL